MILIKGVVKHFNWTLKKSVKLQFLVIFHPLIRPSVFQTTGSAWTIDVQRTYQSLLSSDDGLIESTWKHLGFLCSCGSIVCSSIDSSDVSFRDSLSDSSSDDQNISLGSRL